MNILTLEDGRQIKFRDITLRDELWIQDEIPNFDEEMEAPKKRLSIIAKIMSRLCVEHEDVAFEIKTDVDAVKLVNLYFAICRKSRPPEEDLVPESVKKKMIERRLKMMFLCGGLLGFSLSTTICLLAIHLH